MSQPAPNYANILDLDRERELRAWRTFFACGQDPLRQLGALGYTSADSLTKAKGARLAWRRLGAEHLRRWPTTLEGHEPWALRQFGPPETG